MENLIKTHFLSLLSALSNESNEDKLAANYEEFTEELMSFCKNETDCFDLLRTLKFVHIEFFSQEQNLHKQEKCLVESYVKKSLLLIESEIEICEMRIKYTATVVNEKINNQKKIVSNLDWDISENYIIELATSLHRAKVAYKNGVEATFIDIEQHLERFFNRSPIKRPYNKKSKLPDRVTITPFLDKLKDSFLEDYNSRLDKSRDKAK